MMQSLHLSDQDLRETLQRAREIAEQSRDLVATEESCEEYLRAAEEVGIPRQAVLQALRERFLIPAEPFEVGQMVFAPSMDGFWYPAELLSITPHTAKVRFVSGGEHTCAAGDLRPLALVPGRKLQADVKGWGWYKSVVERYDPEGGKVHIVHDDWAGTKERVPLHKLRLAPEHAEPARKEELDAAAAAKRAVQRATLLAGTVGVGLGLLLSKLLPLIPFLPFR
jgi:hypothetical protein